MPKKLRVAAKSTPPADSPKQEVGLASTGVRLRTPQGELQFTIPKDSRQWVKDLQKAAMQWSYIVRSRERWNQLEKSSEDQATRARQQLQQLGLTAPNALTLLAGGGLVEVVIPYESEKNGWEARVFPWEYAIASATREARDGK